MKLTRGSFALLSLLVTLFFATPMVAEATDPNVCRNEASALLRAEDSYYDAYLRRETALGELLNFRDEHRERITSLDRDLIFFQFDIPRLEEQRENEIRLAEREDRFCIICEGENEVRDRWNREITAARARLSSFQAGYTSETNALNARLARFEELEQRAAGELSAAEAGLNAARRAMSACGAARPSDEPTTRCQYEEREVQIATDTIAGLRSNSEWAERYRDNTTFSHNLRLADLNESAAYFAAEPGSLSQQKEDALHRVRRDNPFCFNICEEYIREQADYNRRIIDARWNASAVALIYPLEAQVIDLRIGTGFFIEDYYRSQIPPAEARLTEARRDLVQCAGRASALRSVSKPSAKNQRCNVRPEESTLAPCAIKKASKVKNFKSMKKKKQSKKRR
jgi:hypothetical protein